MSFYAVIVFTSHEESFETKPKPVEDSCNNTIFQEVDVETKIYFM